MKQEEWINFQRKPMKKGGVFHVSDRVIFNEDTKENVSEGSSCLVYHG